MFFWIVLLLGTIIFHELNPFRGDVRSVILKKIVYIYAGYTLCCNGHHQTFMICSTALCFLLWIIGFEKKEKSLTEHYMHIRQKTFLSFHIIGFCTPISIGRSKTPRTLNRCKFSRIPFHGCLLLRTMTFNYF